jgi:hypothetical protein
MSALGPFASFPPSRRVRFAPKSGRSANARVYEYTPYIPDALRHPIRLSPLAYCCQRRT